MNTGITQGSVHTEVLEIQSLLYCTFTAKCTIEIILKTVKSVLDTVASCNDNSSRWLSFSDHTVSIFDLTD